MDNYSNWGVRVKIGEGRPMHAGDVILDLEQRPRRLFGLAERAWAPDPAWAREGDEQKSAALFREAWSEFVNVLGKRELPRVDREMPGLNYRIPTPGLKAIDGQVHCSLGIPPGGPADCESIKRFEATPQLGSGQSSPQPSLAASLDRPASWA